MYLPFRIFNNILRELAKFPGFKHLKLQRFWNGHIGWNENIWTKNCVMENV